MALDFTVITANLSFFALGFRTTLELTALTVAGGMILGMPLAIARNSDVAVSRYLALVIIEVVRGIPVLMLIFWVYFMLPRLIGTSIPSYVAGLAALVIFNTGYTAEIIRGGLQAVERGNIEAARSSGLGWFKIMWLIVLPQALSNMAPALMSQAVMVYKTTSLVFVIGVFEFFDAANIVNNREIRPIEIFLFVGLVYFIPSTVVSRLNRMVERRRMLSRNTAVRN